MFCWWVGEWVWGGVYVCGGRNQSSLTGSLQPREPLRIMLHVLQAAELTAAIHRKMKSSETIKSIAAKAVRLIFILSPYCTYLHHWKTSCHTWKILQCMRECPQLSVLNKIFSHAK